LLLLLLLLLAMALNIMEVFVGGNGHTGDQQHHLAEAELLILVYIEVLHDFVNGGLVFHMLQRKGQVSKLLLNQELQLPLGQGVF
ncbi:hypothetical protein N334_08431, partial [Pelecanus crispus]